MIIYYDKRMEGDMVVLSLDSYSRHTEPEEYAMDIADAAAESTDERLTHEQVFDSLRRKIIEVRHVIPCKEADLCRHIIHTIHLLSKKHFGGIFQFFLFLRRIIPAFPVIDSFYNIMEEQTVSVTVKTDSPDATDFESCLGASLRIEFCHPAAV